VELHRVWVSERGEGPALSSWLPGKGAVVSFTRSALVVQMRQPFQEPTGIRRSVDRTWIASAY
jgi:hypothetical protein